MLTPALVLLGATAALGCYLGLQFLRGVRNKPVLIGVHLILGFAGLEAMFVGSRGMQLSGSMQQSSFATLTLLTLVFAAAVGFISPLIGRQSRRAGTFALAAHAAIATTGLILAVVLAGKL